MKNIGFYGGSSIVELDNASDMSEFFNILNLVTRNEDEKILLERLYQKYVLVDDLEKTSLLFKELRSTLSDNHVQKFNKYFEGVEHCIQSAKGFYEDWGKYKPVRIVCTDMPYFMTDKERPLEEYDALGSGDLPFWLR